jgi:hypothetical protein
MVLSKCRGEIPEPKCFAVGMWLWIVRVSFGLRLRKKCCGKRLSRRTPHTTCMKDLSPEVVENVRAAIRDA